MALRITRRPLAREDLLEIWEFIAEDNEAAADRTLDRIESALRSIASNPHMGRARPELRPGVRSFPVGSYILFYRAMADCIELVRVLNTYRNVDGGDVEGESGEQR